MEKFNEKHELVEVELANADDFLKVKETLTRMGIASKNSKTLHQSCHILHKKGRYFILHFKEMFKLDGKISTITTTDLQRRNTIARLLSEWGLVKLIDPTEFAEEDLLPVYQVKIISFGEKDKWQLIPKYNIGKKFTRGTNDGK